MKHEWQKARRCSKIRPQSAQAGILGGPAYLIPASPALRLGSVRAITSVVESRAVI